MAIGIDARYRFIYRKLPRANPKAKNERFINVQLNPEIVIADK